MAVGIPAWEAGQRGGYRCEHEYGSWPVATAIAVLFRQLGTTVDALGEPGTSGSTDCYPRHARWLRFYTPTMTEGLWRVEASWGATTLILGWLSVMPEDFVWHTYDSRRRADRRVYKGMGPVRPEAQR